MVHYKISYFPIRGVAEVSRQILSYAGQEFEDNRIDGPDWRALKPTTPFGQLPILEVDGKVLAQSHTIHRYLAREFGLNGKTAWDEALVNSIADQHKDYASDIRPYFIVKVGYSKGDVDALYKDVFLPAFKKHYALFTKFLKASGSGYLIGDSLTYVDLLLAQTSADLLEENGSILDEFPEMKAHQERVHSDPKLKKWLETRPVSSY